MQWNPWRSFSNTRSQAKSGVRSTEDSLQSKFVGVHQAQQSIYNLLLSFTHPDHIPKYGAILRLQDPSRTEGVQSLRKLLPNFEKCRLRIVRQKFHGMPCFGLRFRKPLLLDLFRIFGILGPRVGPCSPFLGSGSLISPFKPETAPVYFLGYSWVWNYLVSVSISGDVAYCKSCDYLQLKKTLCPAC